MKILTLSWSHKATENPCDMMTVDKEELIWEHDTTMFGDPDTWLPIRVTYSRELKVKADLGRL